jgi:hypothetical protein
MAGMEIWGLIVGGGLTALGALAKTLFDLWKTRRKDAIDEWREIAAGHQQALERHEASAQQQQRAMEALHQDRVACREEVAELRSTLHFSLDAMTRMRDGLVKLGQDPGPIPEMPRPHPPEASSKADFLLRQAQQGMALVQRADEVARSNAPPA